MIALALVLLMVGCGESSPEAPPLPESAQVVAEARSCEFTDSCRNYEIVTGVMLSDRELKAAQAAELRAAGWKPREGVTRNQTAACSPDGKMFISFATGRGVIADERLANRSNRGLLWSEELRQ